MRPKTFRLCRDCPKKFIPEGRELLCPWCLAQRIRRAGRNGSKRLRRLKEWPPRLCVDCGTMFQAVHGQGRPFTRCKECRR